MKHIRQKNSSLDPNEAYTVVNVEDWNGELEDHPSIKNEPYFYEIVDEEIPAHAQYSIYI